MRLERSLDVTLLKHRVYIYIYLSLSYFCLSAWDEIQQAWGHDGPWHMCGLGTGSFVFFKSGWNSRAWGWQHTVRARRLMGQLPRESVNHQSGRPSEFGNFQIQIFQHNDCNGLVWRVIREDELECLRLPASRQMIHVKMIKHDDISVLPVCSSNLKSLGLRSLRFGNIPFSPGVFCQGGKQAWRWAGY